MSALAFAATRIAGLNAVWTGSLVVGFSYPTAVSFFVISRSPGHEASRGAAFVMAIIAALLNSAGLAQTFCINLPNLENAGYAK